VKAIAAALTGLIFATRAIAGALPDDKATPGALYPAVTQANIHSTICRSGWSKSVRPPERFTENLKRRQLYNPAGPYYAPSERLGAFEEDHRVPLSVGGAPADLRNLWPEPRFGVWNAEKKDRLEETIARMVCDGRMTLMEGQAVFLGDWTRGYERLIGQ
jgi:hypothetical protein